jgi:hypothetical protein
VQALWKIRERESPDRSLFGAAAQNRTWKKPSSPALGPASGEDEVTAWEQNEYFNLL